MAAPTRNASASDGFGNVSSRVTTINWGSALANQLYLMVIVTTSKTTSPGVVQSVIDNEGNTWHFLCQVFRNDFVNGMAGGVAKAATLTMMWAYAPSSPSSGTQITTSFDTAIDAGVIGIVRIGGENLSFPIDLNGTLTAIFSSQSNVSATAPTISGLSTNTANVLIIEAIASIGSSETAGDHSIAGSTTLDFSNVGTTFSQTNRANVAMGGKGFTSQQTNFSCDGTAQHNTLMAVTAISADSQPLPGNKKRNWRIVIG